MFLSGVRDLYAERLSLDRSKKVTVPTCQRWLLLLPLVADGAGVGVPSRVGFGSGSVECFRESSTALLTPFEGCFQPYSLTRLVTMSLLYLITL